MPQMMPINWIMMYLFFMMSFILFFKLNYYNFYFKPPLMKIKINSLVNKKNPWKW